MRSCSAGGMPGPLSRTQNCIHSPSCFAPASIFPSAGVNLTAFSIRLTSTRRAMSASTHRSGGRSGRREVNVWRWPFAAGATSCSACWTRAAGSATFWSATGWPASRRFRSSRESTSRWMRAVECAAMPRMECADSSFSSTMPESTFRPETMFASGERRSW